MGCLKIQAQSNDKLDSLQNLLQNPKMSVDKRVEVMYQLGVKYKDIDKEAFKKVITDLTAYSNQNNSKLGIGYTHLLKINQFLVADDLDSARSEIVSAKQIFKSIKKYDLYLEAVFYETYILYQTGNEEDAFALASKEVENKAYEKHHSQLANLYYIMGSYQLYYVLDLKKTLEYIFLSLDHYKVTKNKAGIIKSYHMIAHCYWTTKDYDQSFEYAQRCLKMIEKDPSFNVGLYVAIHGLISELYLEKKEYDNAYKYCNKAIKLCEKFGRKEYHSGLLVNSLKVDYARKYFDSMEYKSQKILDMSKLKNNLIYAHYYLGLAYNHQKKYPFAEKSLKKSASLIDSLDQKPFNVVFGALAESLKKQQKYQEAFHFNTIYFNNKISTLTDEKEKRINELQIQFDVNEKDLKIKSSEVAQQKAKIEMQKKENSIKLMTFFIVSGALILIILGFSYYTNRKKTQLLKIEKQKVSESLHERELLLKEIHHRVKNNLQIVLSLLNIQATEGQSTDIEGFLLKSQSRIISMSLIHQFLYENEELSNIDCKDYFQKLFEHLKSLFSEDQKNVSVHIISHDEQLNNDMKLNLTTAIPLGLILNELFINSIKHAFTHNTEGHIWIELIRIDQDFFELKYHDDGTLLASNETNKSTLGLDLVRQLVKQMKGSVVQREDRQYAYIIKFKML
jgi:two-component sensor histidine kinase